MLKQKGISELKEDESSKNAPKIIHYVCSF